jgi:hypothetical protein
MRDGTPSVVERRLFGVPFYERDDPRTLICHGPKSIYASLVEAVKNKWPEDARP